MRHDSRPVRVAVVVGVAVLLVVGAASLSATPAGLPPTQAQHVEGVFADVNGDGLTDFIVDAEVILNRGPVAPKP